MWLTISSTSLHNLPMIFSVLSILLILRCDQTKFNFSLEPPHHPHPHFFTILCAISLSCRLKYSFSSLFFCFLFFFCFFFCVLFLLLFILKLFQWILPLLAALTSVSLLFLTWVYELLYLRIPRRKRVLILLFLTHVVCHLSRVRSCASFLNFLVLSSIYLSSFLVHYGNYYYYYCYSKRVFN